MARRVDDGVGREEQEQRERMEREEDHHSHDHQKLDHRLGRLEGIDRPGCRADGAVVPRWVYLKTGRQCMKRCDQ